MKKDSYIRDKMILKIRRIVSFLRNPSEFMKQEPLQHFDFGMIIALGIWWAVNNYHHILSGEVLQRVFNIVASVVLMSAYLYVLVLIGQGNKNIKIVFNLSVYIHFFCILLNAAPDTKIFILFIYVIGHFYILYLHCRGLTEWLKCKEERLRLLFIIEIAIVIIGFMNTLMIYAGHYMLYSTKLLYYPLA